MEGPGPRVQGSGQVLPVHLPIHGFVLAGGKSSRMGEDKALLRFCGRPMVEIAVDKLRGFCAAVGIAGNRHDLAEFAPVVAEARVDVGPAAGIEAGLAGATQPWVMFLPVDVPQVPGDLLRRWAQQAMRSGVTVSYLGTGGKQPAFCLLRRDRLGSFSRALDGGERRLEALLRDAAKVDGVEVRMYGGPELYGEDGEAAPSGEMMERWFANVNTPEDLAAAEAWAREMKVDGV